MSSLIYLHRTLNILSFFDRVSLSETPLPKVVEQWWQPLVRSDTNSQSYMNRCNMAPSNNYQQANYEFCHQREMLPSWGQSATRHDTRWRTVSTCLCEHLKMYQWIVRYKYGDRIQSNQHVYSDYLFAD